MTHNHGRNHGQGRKQKVCEVNEIRVDLASIFR